MSGKYSAKVRSDAKKHRRSLKTQQARQNVEDYYKPKEGSFEKKFTNWLYGKKKKK